MWGVYPRKLAAVVCVVPSCLAKRWPGGAHAVEPHLGDPARRAKALEAGCGANMEGFAGVQADAVPRSWGGVSALVVLRAPSALVDIDRTEHERSGFGGHKVMHAGPGGSYLSRCGRGPEGEPWM